MANRKTTRKISKKVQHDLKVDKPSKKSSKSVKTKLKKLSAGAIFLAILLLVVGVVGGYFGFQYISKNDCFVIIGEEEINLTLNEAYVDEGVKVVAFGKDDTKKVNVETNLKQNSNGSYYAEQEGTYYIKYTVDNIKYGTIFKVQKIRLIHFVEPTEESEVVGNE